MNIFKVKTASGSTYTVDTLNGFWSHNDGPPEQLWMFLTGHPGDVWNETPEPVVGERMYLASRDHWRVSSLVVSYEAEIKDGGNNAHFS